MSSAAKKKAASGTGSGKAPDADSGTGTGSAPGPEALPPDASTATQPESSQQSAPPKQPEPPKQPKQPKQPKAPLPELLLPDAGAWRDWLEAHHAQSPGVLLVLGRKGGTVTELSYNAALQEALCFGWIDGQANRRDGESYLQRFTPRRPRSIWSQRNVGFVEQLEAQGKMHPAGRAAVEQAKADGRWEDAYAGSATAQVPEDLLAAIAEVPAAQAAYDILNAQNRFALYFRLKAVKTPAGRERKIAALVRMLAEGATPYPQRQAP